MFGYGKKKIEIKTVEDYVKNEDTPLPYIEEKPAARESSFGKIKVIVPSLIGFLVLLILVIAAYGKIAALTAELADLRSQSKTEEVSALKSQISGLAAQLEKTTKIADQARNDVAKLERDLEAEKTQQRVRAEAAAKKTAAAAAAATADKKKKPPVHR